MFSLQSKKDNTEFKRRLTEYMPEEKVKFKGYFPFRRKLFELTEVGNGLTENEIRFGPEFGKAKDYRIMKVNNYTPSYLQTNQKTVTSKKQKGLSIVE